MKTLADVRTPLFVPGDRPERFGKAAASGADAVIIDLEDAVRDEAKPAARQSAASHSITDQTVIVRINGSNTPWFEDDLAALRHVRLSAVMLPKAEAAAVVGQVHQALGKTPVIPLIETARGLFNLAEVLGAEGVAVAAFGALDMALDLGCAVNWEALLLARQQLVLHSRLAGLPPPLDGATPTFDKPDLVEAEARRAADLGFGGKLLIHPAQVAPAIRGLRPDREAEERAERILAAAGPGGAVKLGGAMIDRPILERAARILAARDR